MRALFIILFVSLFGTHIYAQDKPSDTAQTSLQKIKNEIFKKKDSFDQGLLNKDTLISQARQLSDEQFKTMLLSEEQKQKQIEDENFARKHRWRSFDFQYTASIIIFILVIVIVLSGIFFSGWQFSFTLKQIKLKEGLLQLENKARAAETQKVDTVLQPSGQGLTVTQVPEAAQNSVVDMSSLKSDLELSTTGIKANSSVLGVIILVLSIAFFYLYIIYVYPIKYLTPSLQDNKSDSAIVKEK